MAVQILTTLSEISTRAAELHGGPAALQQSMPDVMSDDQIRAIADDRWLAGMAKVIMRSGFSWKVVENKWPGFEVAFLGFDPHRVAMFSEDDLARLLADASIIRNGQKIRAIQENAFLVTGLIKDHRRCDARWGGAGSGGH